MLGHKPMGHITCPSRPWQVARGAARSFLVSLAVRSGEVFLPFVFKKQGWHGDRDNSIF